MQMGPASIKLLKQNLDPTCPPTGSNAVYGCWDTQFVISEVNADINMWVKKESAQGGWELYTTTYTDPFGDVSLLHSMFFALFPYCKEIPPKY